jgi:hypothetical protein
MKKNKITFEDIMNGYPKETWYTKIYDYFVYTIPYRFNDFRYEIKMKYQLFTKGYNDRQVWGFKTEIAELNVKLLTELRDGKVGHPCGLTQKKWDKILGKIIDGFKAQLEIDAMWDLDKKAEAKLEKQWKEGMALYTEWFANLWD